MINLIRTATLIMMTVFLFGCGGSDSHTVEKTVVVTEDPVVNEEYGTIVGTWTASVPSTGCVIRHTYYSNGNYEMSALNRYIQGTYTFDEYVDVGQRHRMVISYTYDNMGQDCGGYHPSVYGYQYTFFADFVNSNLIDIYEPRGTTPLIRLAR